MLKIARNSRQFEEMVKAPSNEKFQNSDFLNIY